MGLIDFVRDAGARLFGKKEEQEAAATQRPAITLDEIRAKALAKIVRTNNLEVKDLVIVVQGEQATVRGTVADQATRERVVLCCGNAHGISKVDDQLVVEKKGPEAQFYTVVKGDTLSRIAKQYYGNANKYPVIFEANKPMLEHPDRIYPGQELRIPPAQ